MRMKVIEVDDISHCFIGLDEGSVFRCGNGIYVKVKGEKENAVALETWELTHLNPYTSVAPVGAELRIGVDA